MKLTRKQLRTLIAEMARTPMQDPTKDMDPEVLDKIQKGFYDSGEEESIKQGDEIAAALGGPDYLYGLKDRYGVEPIMEEFEFAEPYLSTDQFKHLMQAKGQELVMAFDGRGLVGFKRAGVSSDDFIIDPEELHEMVTLVEAKQPQFGGKVLYDYENTVIAFSKPDLRKTVLQSTQYYIDRSTNYYQTLLEFFVAIIKISKITYISEFYAAGFGLGGYGHTADGSYRLDSPFYELQESGKLFLGYQPAHFTRNR